MRLSREQYMNALARHSEASGSNYWGDTKRSSSGGGGGGVAEQLAVTGARASISAWLPASTDYAAVAGGSGSGGGGFLPLLTRSADAAAAATYGFGEGAYRGAKGVSAAGVRSVRDAGGVGAASYYRPLALPSTAATAHRTLVDGLERWPVPAALESGGGGGRIETTSKATLYDLTQVLPLQPLGLAYGASAPTPPTPLPMAAAAASGSAGPNSFLVRKERLSPGYPTPPSPPSKNLTHLSRTGRLGAGGGGTAADPAAATAATLGREDAARGPQAETGDVAGAASALEGPEMTPSWRDGDFRSQEGRPEAARDEPLRLPQPISGASKEQDAPRSILKIPKAGGGEQSNEQALHGPLEGGVRIAAHTYFLTLNHVTGKGSKVSASGGSRSGGGGGGGGALSDRSGGGSFDGEKSSTPAVGGARGSLEEIGSTPGRWDRAGGVGGRTSAASADAVHGPAKSSPGATAASCARRESAAAGADGATSGSAAAADRAGSDGGSSEGSSKSSPSNSADRKRSVRFRDSLYELKEFLPWEPIYSDVVDSAGRAIPAMRPYVL